MYTLFLILHSWLRWIAIATGVGATAAATGSASGGGGARAGLFFMIAMDLQVLIGVLLYLFISPTTAAVFQNFSAAMQDSVAGFWAVAHGTMMLRSGAVAHPGPVLGRKA